VDAVLLIHPPQTFGRKQTGLVGYSPPVGLLYLASALKRAGHPTYVADMDTDHMGLGDIFRIIDEKRITVLGVSTFTRTRHISYHILDKVRENYPGIYLLAGGPHCSLLPEEAFAASGADAVVDGEAESEIVEIVNARMKGIIRPELPMELDDIPFPLRNMPFIRPRAYGNIINIKHTRYSTFLSSSRGCPYRCTFCSRIHTSKVFRWRSPDNILDELEMLDREGHRGILFVDDNFTAMPDRASDIAGRISQRDIRMDCLIQSRCISPGGFWDNLVDAGFNVVSLGVEHIKPDIVEYFGKHSKPGEWCDVVEASVRSMNQAGAISSVSLILGAPMEARRDAEAAVEFCRRIGADVIATNELEFVCGSRLWSDAVEAGLFPKDRLYMRATDIRPEKRGYITELNRRAWRMTAMNLPRIARKILKVKRDKKTPLASIAGWLLWRPKSLFREGYREYAYGRRGEEGSSKR
jgi:anaerobic magnesium-protoporphyrin IX monomethyl ester cyclase